MSEYLWAIFKSPPRIGFGAGSLNFNAGSEVGVRGHNMETCGIQALVVRGRAWGLHAAACIVFMVRKCLI